MTLTDSLNILLLSAEAAPFAKTGGVADVAGSLPKALTALGHDVRVAMPRYGRIGIEKFNLVRRLERYPVKMADEEAPAELYEGRIGEKTPIYFVENTRYYDREGIYMYPDDAERFIFFCRAVLEALPRLNWRPDIIHCHDWHTAIVPNWLKTIYAGAETLRGAASVYTIHNLAYQGIYGYRVLEIAGVAALGFIAHPQMQDLSEVVDFMARGIYFADVVNTVSERYAQEILTPEYGERLDPLLRDRRDRLYGILNGIDTVAFNPATDPYIVSHFDANHLEGRPANKEALQREAGLTVASRAPLIGVIARLADSKGFDLLTGMIEPLLTNLPVQMVILGTGEQKYHDALGALARRHPDRLAVYLTFNASLAQRIYAGSDIFLMPSRFEPCGLGQMIAMRYGSIPVVRATGGLADTVHDFDPLTDQGNGFSFEAYDPMALYTAIVRAAETYRRDDLWRRLMLRGMLADFSWETSARKYVDLYRRALASRGERRDLDQYRIPKP
jgi:starch synthase